MVLVPKSNWGREWVFLTPRSAQGTDIKRRGKEERAARASVFRKQLGRWANPFTPQKGFLSRQVSG